MPHLARTASRVLYILWFLLWQTALGYCKLIELVDDFPYPRNHWPWAGLEKIYNYGAQHLVTTNFVQMPILEIKKKKITSRNPAAHTAEFNFWPMVAAGWTHHSKHDAYHAGLSIKDAQMQVHACSFRKYKSHCRIPECLAHQFDSRYSQIISYHIT